MLLLPSLIHNAGIINKRVTSVAPFESVVRSTRGKTYWQKHAFPEKKILIGDLGSVDHRYHGIKPGRSGSCRL